MQTLEQLLTQSRDDLVSENMLRHRASLNALESSTLLPGIRSDARAPDFDPIEPVHSTASMAGPGRASAR